MSHFKFPRRQFLAGGAAAAGGACSIAMADSHSKRDNVATQIIQPGATVLFQGDSITDTGRERGVNQPNHSPALGTGYAFLAAADLLVQRPTDGLKFFNRGVSGNKVYQLAERWQEDCLDLKPDIVSILIGVNDIWHWLNGQYDGTIETYRNDYLALAERTKDALPSAKLVICEPFVLKVGAVSDKWFPKFDEFRAAAHDVFEAHGDCWVPFQSTMDSAAKFAPAKIWASDGVHPSPHGAALLSSTWLRSVGG